VGRLPVPRLTAGLCLALAVALGAVAGAAPAASETTITFESGVAPGDLVSNQYAGQGITFVPNLNSYGINERICYLPELIGGLAPTPNHSGTRAIKLAGCGGEFPLQGAFASFSKLRSHVSVRVLDEGSGSPDPTFFLRGYDVDGNLVAKTDWRSVGVLDWYKLEISTATPKIAFISVGNYYYTGRMLVDDVSFDEPQAPPDFKLTFTYAPRLYPGQKASFPVSVQRLNGSSGPIALSLSGLPPSVTASFSPATLTGTQTDSTLSVSVAPSAELGTFTATVTATPKNLQAGSSPRSVANTWSIVRPFAFAEENPVVEVAPCTPTTATLKIAVDSLFSGPLSASVESTDPYFDVAVSAVRPVDVYSRALDVTVTPKPGSESELTPPGRTSWVGTLTLASAAYGKVSTGLRVRALAGRIESVIPKLTPVPSSVGRVVHKAEVVVTGIGFCPKAKVWIGNRKAVSPAVTSSLPGRVLKASVPRLATTGFLHVETEGQDLKAPITVRSFRNTNGFAFKNFIPSTPNPLTPQMVDEIFTPAQTNLGWPFDFIRKPEAIIFRDVVNKVIQSGICFGMAFNGLAGGAFARSVAAGPDAELFRTLVEDFSLQFSDEVIGESVPQVISQGLGAWLKADIAAIEDAIVKEGAPIVSLLNGFGSGHAVVPYGVEELPSGRVAVDVYNPNVPYAPKLEEKEDGADHEKRELDQSRIEIDPDTGHWWFPELGWNGPAANLIVLRRHTLPYWNDDIPHLPNVFAILGIRIFLGSAGDAFAQVEDGAGHALLGPGGRLAPPAKRPPGVALFAPLSGFPSPPRIVYATPRVGELKVTVRRRAAAGSLAMFGTGLAAALETSGDRGGRETVSFSPRSGQVTFASEAARARLRASLAAAVPASRALAGRGSAQAERVAVVETTAARGGETIAFPGGRALVVEHEGEPASVKVSLWGMGRDGLPETVSLPALRVGAGAKLTVEPLDWRRLGAAKVRLTVETKGRRQSRLVSARLLAGRPFVRVLRAALATGKRGKAAIRLTLRVARRPDLGSLRLSGTLLRRGRAAATLKPRVLPSLRPGLVTVTLPLRRLPGGGYRLRLTLLEVTTRGLTQSAVTRTQTLPVRG